MPITLFTGSMYSGKTSALIDRLTRHQIAGHDVKLYKPALDDRYDPVDVVSHNGRRLTATPIADPVAALAADRDQALGDATVIGFDEVQFFPVSAVGNWLMLMQLLSNDRDVYFYLAGLDFDFRGRVWPVTQALALHVKLVQCEAVCMRCGIEGPCRTQRLSDGLPVTEGDTVQVGGLETYAAVCQGCFVRS